MSAALAAPHSIGAKPESLTSRQVAFTSSISSCSFFLSTTSTASGACGSRTFEAFLFFRPTQCEAFARGDSYADVWELRNAGLPPDDPRVTHWSHLQNPFREPPPPAARGVIGRVRIDTRRRLGRGSQEAPSHVPTQSVTARPLGVHQPR